MLHNAVEIIVIVDKHTVPFAKLAMENTTQNTTQNITRSAAELLSPPHSNVVVALTCSSFLVLGCLLVFAFSATWTYVRHLRQRIEQAERRDMLRDRQVEELCGKLQNMVKYGAITVDREKIEQMEGQKKLTVSLGEMSGVHVGLGANIVPDAGTVARYGFTALKWALGGKS